MRRLPTPLLALVLLLGGCATTETGAPPPDCELANGSSVVLMAQAVPGAEVIPCVAGLPAGWSVSNVFVGSGSASFQFDSDDFGDAFLDVELTESCPARAGEEHVIVSGAVASRSQAVAAARAVARSVAVIPEAGDNVVVASAVVLDLDRAGVPAWIAPAGTSVDARLALAQAKREPAVLVDDLTNAEGIAVLVDADTGERSTHATDELVALLAGSATAAEPTTYRGGWHYRFAGGCVTYRFDAEGPGATAIEEQTASAVSFVARATLDRFTRANVGLRLDP